MIEKVKIMRMLLTRHFIKELQMQKIKERDYSLYIGIILMFAIEVIGIYLISNNLKMKLFGILKRDNGLAKKV